MQDIKQFLCNKLSVQFFSLQLFIYSIKYISRDCLILLNRIIRPISLFIPGNNFTYGSERILVVTWRKSLPLRGWPRTLALHKPSRGETAPILTRRRVKMTPGEDDCDGEPSRWRTRRSLLYILAFTAHVRLSRWDTTPYGHARRIPADTAGRKQVPLSSCQHTQWTPRSPSSPSLFHRRHSSMLIGFPFLKWVRVPDRFLNWCYYRY